MEGRKALASDVGGLHPLRGQSQAGQGTASRMRLGTHGWLFS